MDTVPTRDRRRRLSRLAARRPATPEEMARTLGALYLSGAGLIAGMMALGAWPQTNVPVFAAVGVVAAAVGAVLAGRPDRVRVPATHGLLVAGSVLVVVARLAAGGSTAAAAVGAFTTLPVMFALMYLPAGAALAHLAVIAAAHAAVHLRAGPQPGWTAEVLVGVGTALAAGAVVRNRSRAQMVAEQETEHARLHDDLTGLASVALTSRHIGEQLDSGRPVQVVRVDIDRFREVNEALGIEVGNAVLQQVAGRLQGMAGTEGIVGRIAADDFLIVATADAAGAQLGEQIVERLRPPLTVEGLSIAVEARVGVARGGGDHDDIDAGALLLRATSALRRAKADNMAVSSVAEVPAARSTSHLTLLHELRGAIGSADRRGQLEAWFQPQVDLRTRRIVGAEALVRWRHPDHGLLTPGMFMPLAEQTTMMPELLAEMLQQAAALSTATTAAGRPLRISVNTSPRDLAQQAFAAHLREMVTDAGAECGQLTIEITESAMVDDLTRAERVVRELREAGFSVSLDDFGTGFSSMVHLQMLPVNELKIDRSFVARMIDDPNAASIVATTVTLAQSLGLHVVAEGVEDESTHDWLTAMACDTGQGWLYGRPMPAGELLALLNTASVAGVHPS